MDYKVSVIIVSYNQEKYIEKAIQSVLMQKTNFQFEILLGDDCSTDSTPELVKKYESQLKAYFRKENVGGTQNHYDLLLKAKGKYITILEGDDYWLGENRLQVLADFLDENEEYMAVGHVREMRDAEGNLLGIYPNKNSIACKVTREGTLFGEKKIALSALMYRNFFKDSKGKYDFILEVDRHQDDVTVAQLILQKGPAYNLNQCFGAYIVRRNAGDSNFNSLYSETERMKKIYYIHKKTAEFFGTPYMYDYNEAIKGCALLFNKLKEGKIRDFCMLVKVMGARRLCNMVRFLPVKLLKKMGILSEEASPYIHKCI